MDFKDACAKADLANETFLNNVSYNKKFKGKKRIRNAKLTNNKAVAIYKDTRPRDIIAAEYGICLATVSHIKQRKAWSFATRGLGAPQTIPRLTQAQVIDIYRSKLSVPDLMLKYKRSYYTIRNIKNDISYLEITKQLKKG